MTFDIQDVETFIPVYQDTTEPGREFQSLLTKTGFSVRKCEAVEFSYTFSNKNQLLASLKAVNPFLQRIPPDLQADFLADCVSSLLSLDTPVVGPTPTITKVEAKYRLIVAHFSKN